MDAHLDLDAAESRTVADVMVKRPKTLPASATVAQARSLFENPRVLVALLEDGGRYAGEVARDDVPAGAGSDQPVGGYAVTGETIGAEQPMSAAVEQMERLDQERLAVVGAEGELLGLLCLNRKHGHFCVDDA
jgi:CBS domain-containing protein